MSVKWEPKRVRAAEGGGVPDADKVAAGVVGGTAGTIGLATGLGQALAPELAMATSAATTTAAPMTMLGAAGTVLGGAAVGVLGGGGIASFTADQLSGGRYSDKYYEDLMSGEQMPLVRRMFTSANLEGARQRGVMEEAERTMLKTKINLMKSHSLSDQALMAELRKADEDYQKKLRPANLMKDSTIVGRFLRNLGSTFTPVWGAFRPSYADPTEIDKYDELKELRREVARLSDPFVRRFEGVATDEARAKILWQQMDRYDQLIAKSDKPAEQEEIVAARDAFLKRFGETYASAHQAETERFLKEVLRHENSGKYKGRISEQTFLFDPRFQSVRDAYTGEGLLALRNRVRGYSTDSLTGAPAPAPSQRAAMIAEE